MANDITGQRFGRLVAVKFEYYNKRHEACWLFKCDCGNEKIMPINNIKWGRVRSCGCLQREHAASLHKQDITGCKFSRLTAIRPTDGRDDTGSIIWECRCDCGGVAYYSVNRLLHGTAKSCGCLYKETRSTSSEKRSDKVEGTLISSLVSARTLRSNNSSGHTGVYFEKRHEKWQAYTNFQKKRYNLGLYKTKEQAIDARIAAERKFHDPMIKEQWDKLTEKSKQKYLRTVDTENN